MAQALGATPRGCYGRGGRPSPQAAWGGRAVRHPTTTRRRPPPRKRAGRPAHVRGVQPARLPACNRHLLRRATGTSRGVQPARLPARNRRVLRRATGTSLRRAICAVRRTPTRARTRDLARVIATLGFSVRPRARFVIWRSCIFLGYAFFEKGLQRQIVVGTPVNSQERRALHVPLISRG